MMSSYRDKDITLIRVNIYTEARDMIPPTTDQEQDA